MSSNKKVALITGASSGIGEAASRLFAAKGYRVAMAARRLERLEELQSEIETDGGEALPIQADIAKLADIEAMVAAVIDRWGRIDLLINNAGFGRFGWLEELDPQRDIQGQIQVNLTGSILTARAVLPHMIRQRSGHMINMASMSGLVGTPTYTVYSATKFGLRGFSQSLRREVRVWGVRVSVVFPGGVASEEFAAKSGSEKRKTGISTPTWLKLSVEDVAQGLYRLALRPRSILVLPWLMRYSVWLNNMFPGIVDRVVENQFVKPERGL